MNAPLPLATPPTWASPDDLQAAPELASLAILDAALAIAEHHVLVANPQAADLLGVPDPCDRYLRDLLRDLRRATASLHEYVCCTRALLQDLQQRDVPF